MKTKSKSVVWMVGLSFLLITSCGETYLPKPRGYHRIAFPTKEYQAYNQSCPFAFEYPTYSEIVKDTLAGAEPCWMDVYFPTLNGRIHLSYKPISDDLGLYVEDAWTLVNKHTVKADAIDNELFNFKEKNVYGILFDIKGNAASSIQFFITDSTHHYIRGSLYFNSEPNKDSLAPVIDFVRKDIVHLIETFEWK